MQNLKHKFIKQCDITADILNNCEEQFGVGGLKPIIYIANEESILGYTFDANNEYVTDINLSSSPNGEFFKWENVEFQNEAHATFNLGDNLNYTHSIVMKLRAPTAERLSQFHKLAGARVVVIIQSRIQNNPVLPTLPENRIYLFGAFNALRMTNGSSDFGPGQDVLSGFSITLEGYETKPEFEIRPLPATYTSTTPISEFLGIITV